MPWIARAEIARDWDRSGHTLYRPELVRLFKTGDKQWLVAFGEAAMGYMSEPYNCDIAIIRYDSAGKSEETIAKEAHNLLEKNDFFEFSPIYAMANGHLCFCKYNEFAGLIKNKLIQTGNRFAAKNAKFSDEKLLFSTGQPVVLSMAEYEAELADFLCDTLRELLQ